MTVAARSPRLAALALAFVMVLPTVAEAGHTAPLTPDAPHLPGVKPGDECVDVPGLQEEILAIVNNASAGNTSYFAKDREAPLLCDTSGAPIPLYKTLINESDHVIGQLRSALKEIQRQYDERLEFTLPEGAIVRPNVTLLDEDFSGARKTGFGNWTIITQKGEAPGFQIEAREAFNGTAYDYRFGTNESYPRGIHQWLVSPEIDLSVVKGDAGLLRQAAERSLYAQKTIDALFCRPTVYNPAPGIHSLTNDRTTPFDLCGGVVNGAGTQMLRDAYRAAAQRAFQEMPLVNHMARLQIDLSWNFAYQTDGFRLWLYAGDQAPDRKILYDPSKLIQSPGANCGDPLTDPVTGQAQQARTLMCRTPDGKSEGQAVGGYLLYEGAPGMARSQAFANNGYTNHRDAFTGASQGVQLSLNLTPWVPQSVWLLVEVRTMPDTRGEGATFFSDNAFNTTGRFGLDIHHVLAKGEAWPRYLRIKDVAGTYYPMPVDNPFGDPVGVRTTTPPGNDPLAIRVQNAGTYVENATLLVSLRDQLGSSGSFQTNPFFERALDLRDLKPSEVRNVLLDWPKPLLEGRQYKVDARLLLNDTAANTDNVRTNVTLTNLTGNADPQRTPARPPNQASVTAGGKPREDIAQGIVRAWTERRVTHLVYEQGTPVVANSLQVCAALSDAGECTPAYSGAKGELRYLSIHLRNDGSLPENVAAILTLQKDGLDKGGSILGEARRDLPDLLPGETRQVVWAISPVEVGIYRAILSVQGADGTPLAKNVERFVYVQRTTGLVCFDDLASQRLCGPSFSSSVPTPLRDQPLTAVHVDGAGTAYATTALTQTSGGLYARPEGGAWRMVANLSNASLVAAHVPTPQPGAGFGSIRAIAQDPQGRLYLGGDNGTLLRVDPDGLVSDVPFNASLARTDVHALAWFNGALWAAGRSGGASTGLWFLNATQDEGATPPGPRMDVVNLQFPVDDTQVTYVLDLHALLVSGSTLLAAGEGGFLFNGTRQSNGTVRWSSQWSHARTATAAYDLHVLVEAEGRVWAAGDDGLVMTRRANGSFQSVAPVFLPGRDVDLRAAFTTHAGGLYLVDATGSLVTCSTCGLSDPGWSFPTLPLPSIVVDEEVRLPRVVAGGTGGGVTLAVAEGGIVLDFGDRSRYANREDWSTVPRLIARDGGVIQSRLIGGSSTSEAYRGIADDAIVLTTHNGASLETGVSHLTLRLTHFVADAHVGARAAASPPERGPSVRVYFFPYPTWRIAMPSQTSPVASNPDGDTSSLRTCDGYGNSEGRHIRACEDVDALMLHSAEFLELTQGDTWSVYEARIDLSGVQAAVPLFAGVELYKVPGARWVVDDVEVVAHMTNGQTQVLAGWYGPDKKAGTWGRPDSPTSPWLTEFEEAAEALDVGLNSPWHVSSNYADRPIWAANDEMFALEENRHAQSDADRISDPIFPRLRSHWEGRLLTPVIDLSQAYDPVITFNHLYAFRTRVDTSGSNPEVYAPDGGFVEIQYLIEDVEECRDRGYTSPCWSPFYRLHPDDNYPGGARAIGENSLNAVRKPIEHPTLIGPNEGTGTFAGKVATTGRSYWGRNMEPNIQGVYDTPRDTANYEPASFTLSNQTCGRGTWIETNGCNWPTGLNLSGKQVRVAFHLVTYHVGERLPDGTYPIDTYNHTSKESAGSGFSKPGEGWYITDFKVLGTRPLGIDLAASDLALRVGYDADAIGVGPGTDVRVNVTVTNPGLYDVGGYTGTLDVFRVEEGFPRRDVLIQSIALPQQPALEAGQSVNHTFSWSVPAGEWRNYTLRFRVDPLALEDEDPTNNVATLGTLRSPLLARTVRDLAVDFLVSPANATLDITRFVPIFLRNTGNVPLEGITVRRDIDLLRGGSASPAQTPRTWTTNVPLAPGTRTSLALLADQFDPTDDVFWKAGESANFRFSVAATVPGVEVPSATRLVGAFSTFLFDDIESGTRGEGLRGEWTFDEGWGVAPTGFRSVQSYGFGDSVLVRYPDNADASATTPLIQLSSARSARLAFFHQYQFEPGYDGGRVEASVDGGKTWHPLTPLPDLLNDLPLGHNDTYPIVASSVLHDTGDPREPVYVFTGESRDLPLSADGWILSQYDLTSLPAITKDDVPYEQYGSADLAAYGNFSRAATFNDTAYVRVAPSQYSLPTWEAGSLRDGDEGRRWIVENVTERDVVHPLEPGASFWWSGSRLLVDDWKRVEQNAMLNIPVDLTGFAPEGPESILVEWWEWADRFGQMGVQYSPGKGDQIGGASPSEAHFGGAYAFHQGNEYAHTYRWNVTDVKVLEQEGRWLRMSADLTKFKGNLHQVGFLYSPVADAATGERGTRYRDDRGFALADFTVYAVRVQNGIVTRQPVLTTDDAWARGNLSFCTSWNGAATLNDLPCFSATGQPTDYLGTTRSPTADGSDAIGTLWGRVNVLPALPSSWERVNATFPAGPTTEVGQPTMAWWSGGLSGCMEETRKDCLLPGSESRLITPTFDLAAIAGQEAFLTFLQRWAFYNSTEGTGRDPLAGGGVVEIQTYDEQTGAWSPWRQIYSKPDAMDVGTRGLTLQNNVRGGYTSYTVDATPTTDGRYRRLDPPFEPHVDPKTGLTTYFLYSGRSMDVGGAQARGWLPARYDVSEFIGQKVRFGFHVWIPGDAASEMGKAKYQTTLPEQGDSTSKSGWWIGDVSVVGKVLKGSPVELRFHAGTDGNLGEGFWRLDDIGVFGARYGRNVGVFVDPQPQKFGVIQNRTSLVPVTVSNFGDTVRKGLAVEVVKLSGPQIDFSAPGPNATQEGRLLLTDINLAPGQTATVHLELKAPPLLASEGKVTFLLTLKEYNPGNKKFVNVADNEVKGFLSTRLEVGVKRSATFEFPSVQTSPPVPVPGEPLEFRVAAQNSGYAPFQLSLSCTAELVDSRTSMIHEGLDVDREVEHVVERPACQAVDGKTSLDVGEWTNLTYRIVPKQNGTLRLRLAGQVLDGVDNTTIPRTCPANSRACEPVASAIIGGKLVAFTENFTFSSTLTSNWTASLQQRGDLPTSSVSRALWDARAGYREPGAAFLGWKMDDFGFPTGCMPMDDGNGGSAGAACRMGSPRIDLHDFQGQSVFLSFWHKPSFGEGDGGRVYVEVLQDDTRPGDTSAWTPPCAISPLGGYTHALRSVVGTQQIDGSQQYPRDLNPGIPSSQQPSADAPGTNTTLYNHVVGGTSASWDPIAFDLSQVTCGGLNAAGKTVRFTFDAYLGIPNGVARRGESMGWLIDDVSLSPFYVRLAPTEQRVSLRDNTTKAFNLVLSNPGSFTDLVKVRLDETNSSIPPGSMDNENVVHVLPPGTPRYNVPIRITLPRDPSLLPTQYRARFIVESLIDPNAGGVSDMTILFGPRQYPELSLGVQLPPDGVQEGTESFLAVTVENNGLTQSAPTSLCMTDLFEGVGKEPVCVEVPAMSGFFQGGDDSTRVLEMRYRPDRGSLGNHTLVFSLDPEDRIEEYTKDNNLLILTVPVRELVIPDVDVGSAGALKLRDANGVVLGGARDADVTRYEVTAGELLTFEMVVRNSGRAGVTNVDVRAFIGALSLPPKTIPYIAPGGEVALTFNWLAQKGEYAVEFVARSEQVELDVANNRNPQLGVTILTVKGYEVEVTLDEIEEILEPGTQTKVGFKVRNPGNAGEDLVLVARSAEGSSVTLGRDAFYLRAGETYDGVATLTLSSEAVAGEQFMTIDAIARENPMKVASSRAAFRVEASYGGSLLETSAQGEPPALVVPVALRNEGNSLEPWTLHVRLPPGWTSDETLPLKVVVPPRGGKTVELHLRLPADTAPGERILEARATLPDGTTREQTIPVDVGTVRTASVKVASETPKPVQGKLAYAVRVENSGNVEAPFEMLLVGVPPGLEARIEPSTFTLPPGGRALATLLVTPNESLDAGAYVMTGYTRFEGVHPDTRQGQANLQVLKVGLLRPELEVGEADVTPRADLRAGEKVTVRLPVANRGQAEVLDVPVHLYVDDVFVAETRIPRLAPGERTEVVLNWTALGGTHALTLVVDPYRDAVELDRADNAVSTLATVDSGSPLGGFAAERARTPGFGAFALLLAALLAAIPRTGSRRPPR